MLFLILAALLVVNALAGLAISIKTGNVLWGLSFVALLLSAFLMISERL